MKPVLRLLYGYFFAVPWLRWLSLAGVATLVLSALYLLFIAQPFAVQGLAVAGLMALFFGTALMPLMVGRLARSKQAALLPWGRARILLSALLTTAIVAFPLPLLGVIALMTVAPKATLEAAFYGNGNSLAQFLTTTFFWQMYVVCAWQCTSLYIVLWFATHERGVAGMLKSLLIPVAVLFVPPRFVRIDPTISLAWPLSLLLATWFLIVAYLLWWPRIAARLTRRFGGITATTSKGGRVASEVDLILELDRPWRFALAQSVPIAVAALFIREPAAWLFYLTIFGVIAGARAGRAAMLSRTLWLRSDADRRALFDRVEKAFWTHTGYQLAALIALMVAVGTFIDLPTRFLGAGIPLILLSGTTTMYLGLAMTRGIRFGDAVSAVALMLAAMSIALLAAKESTPLAAIAGIEAALAVATLALRALAVRRWSALDWSICRR
ncbi:MAG TPA: hypothetical protein PKE27_03035 [Povalibacter sp.]|uniref:hypothetical protein n=1 Tax=Povalibacter sp. TaxID=1962978 RepID=UPI002CDB36EC|nr:hypothetical protein [Povalibacter sp.]HMN43516.1 hypothetical protein [Povalibacter sp.]